ncbi:MAG: NAD(P)-dependent oxidoreductase, partial [Gammaproteobacteria bacterium HGW-Gammaproteobacteria-12]
MKILLTGGTGFVGRHIAWRLAAEGCEVVFSGRNRDAADEVQRHARAAMRFLPLEHGTPQASAALAEAARGADALVHCAALSAPWGSAEAFQRANVASTEEVITACRTQGVARLVHLSTPSLYFDFQDRLGVRERDP